jgi:hypothetical protein
MRFTNAQYLEKEVVTVSCRNNNAALAILDGQPVFLQDVGKATNFGTDATLFSDANVSGVGLVAGIAKWFKLAGNSAQLTGAQVGDVFEAVAYGFTDAIITLRTRATSTDSWSTSPAIAVGDAMAPETLANNLTRTTTLGNGAAIPPFVAGQSQASQTTGASNATLNGGVTTVTADTVRMKVMVRAM